LGSKSVRRALPLEASRHVTVAAYQRAHFLRTHHAGEEKPSLLWFESL
jgi:hypothetical protein